MSVYKRGESYWFKFVVRGKRIQKPARVKNRKDAEDIERAYRTNLARGEVGIEDKPKKPMPTIGAMLDALEADYKSSGKGSRPNINTIAAARKEFGSVLADALTSEIVERYIRRRTADGKKPATINRVVGMVGTAYKFEGVPIPVNEKEKTVLRHLDETGNERKGFFTDAEFDALEQNLPADLQDFARFGFVTGWRKGEIASLLWCDVEDGIINLRAENAKNGKARKVAIEDELVDLMNRRSALRSTDTPSGTVLNAYLFHRGGQPILEFRKSWATASVAAGLGKMVCPKCETDGTTNRCPKCKTITKYKGRIFHDLRRSAVRNLIRAGVPPSVVMKIVGHKSFSMLMRYDISDVEDSREALLSVGKYKKEKRQKIVGITNHANAAVQIASR